MDDAQDVNAGGEPSMEEILASIRRIIADEKEPEADVPLQEGETVGDDVIELTQMVEEDGSVTDVNGAPAEGSVPQASEPPEAPSAAVSAPAVAPVVATPPKKAAPEAKAAPKADEGLVSDDAASTAASSLSALANTIAIERKAAGSYSPLGNGARTLEEMVLDLMKPILKAWLDENLPPIVDRIVQKEVERIARRVED